ncbi:uncharacterized protein LOC124127059 [Haliotis rufescens]|uniref:uncharacterized protein LOC124127059 n=1 Tax=Haliotis rufescens TaxID=6454 RepID=UPI00201EA07F|nr:uncharacterized protein LOC124127059 [Haliotis rufescens]
MLTTIGTEKERAIRVVKNLAVALGNTQQQQLYHDGQIVSSQYGEPDNLSKYDAKEWLTQQNPVVFALLQSLTNVNSDSTATKHAYLARAYEHLYGARNSNVICPLSFAMNLLLYYVTGSKVACNLSAKTSPSGSYQTILKWINEQAAVPVKCPTAGDIITFFDNNQVLARNWRVRYDAKAMVSVVTTLLHIFPPETTLQTTPHLSPCNWLTYDVIALQTTLPSFISPSMDVFRHYQTKVLTVMLDKVLAEQGADGVSDSFDCAVLPDPPTAMDDTHYTVSRDDDTSKIRIVRSNRTPNKYDIVEAGELFHPDLVVGEPVIINPCSYMSMEVVLRRILEDVGVGISRSWCVIGCDGLPYNLASRVIDNHYTCSICNATDIHGMSDLQKHLDYDHNQPCHNPQEHRTFGNILLLPGPGHMEINMAKASFKLLWDVILKDLGIMLGFRTIRAQDACRHATDHHKAWQMLEIFL